MAGKIIFACFVASVALAEGGLLFGGSTSATVAPQSRGLFGGLLNKTSSLIGGVADGVKDGVNKVTDETSKMITSVTDDAKNFLNSIEAGSFCTCSGLSCGCCADANLAKLKNRFCTKIELQLQNLSISLSAEMNDKPMFSTSISGKNPPPVCAPLGPLPAVTLCIRPYELSLAVSGFRLCLQLETMALGRTLATASFNCFRISGTGTLTLETVDINPEKGYMNFNVSSILPYLPESMKPPHQLPMYPLKLLTGK